MVDNLKSIENEINSYSTKSRTSTSTPKNSTTSTFKSNNTSAPAKPAASYVYPASNTCTENIINTSTPKKLPTVPKSTYTAPHNPITPIQPTNSTIPLNNNYTSNNSSNLLNNNYASNNHSNLLNNNYTSNNSSNNTPLATNLMIAEQLITLLSTISRGESTISYTSTPSNTAPVTQEYVTKNVQNDPWEIGEV